MSPNESAVARSHVSLSVLLIQKNLVNTDQSVKLQKSTQPDSISKFGQKILNKAISPIWTEKRSGNRPNSRKTRDINSTFGAINPSCLHPSCLQNPSCTQSFTLTIFLYFCYVVFLRKSLKLLFQKLYFRFSAVGKSKTNLFQ